MKCDLNNVKVYAYVKNYNKLILVERINFDCKTVEVDLSEGNGDYWEFDFDEVEIELTITGKYSNKTIRVNLKGDDD